MWSCLLLGVPQILRNREIITLARRKNRALLYYLAAHPNPLTREQIFALFFIDHERAAAQQILRTMLYELRKTLGDALNVRDETLALAPETFVDARRFLAGAEIQTTEPAQLDATLALYRGEFLEGFSLPDAPEFEAWVERERERYRAAAIRAHIRLAGLYEAGSKFSKALEALNHALELDDLNEEAQRHALRVQYRNGDRAGAIRRFEQLQKRLDEELGVPPMAETRAIYDAIVTDQPDGTRTAAPEIMRAIGQERVATEPPRQRPRSAPDKLPFVGRAHEMQRLERAAEDGKLLWLEGEPGIGKTRLVEEFLERQTARTVVLCGSAHELEQALPYQPLLDALRSLYAQPDWDGIARSIELAPVWWSELVRLTPELVNMLDRVPAPGSTVDQARLWEAVHQFLMRLGEQQPVVLFLDDVHWADAATIGMLGYAARRPMPAVTLIVTARGIEPGSPAAALLSALTHERRVERVVMRALSYAEVETLTAQLTSSHATALADWLRETTEGNPLLVNELLQYAYDNELLQRDGTLTPEMPEPLLSPTIEQLFEARLARLPDPARRVVQTACVIGREFDFALVRRALDMPEEELLDALDTLERSGMVHVVAGQLYAFNHHLTMQAAYRGLGSARQSVLHRRIAEAMAAIEPETLDARAGLIAQHWITGGMPERAGTFALRAGRYAARLAAWAQAIDFFDRALGSSLTTDERTAALVELGTALVHSGNVVRATDVLLEALVVARANRDWMRIDSILVYLMQSLMPQGRYEEGIRYAREAREEGPEEIAAAAELAWGTAMGLQGANPPEAERHLRAAAELLDAPRGFKSLVTPAKIQYQLAGVLGQQGKWQDAVALYWQALAAVRQDESALDLQRHILLYNNLAYYLHLLHDPSAGEYAKAGLVLAREKGSLTHQAYLMSTSGEIALAQGNLDAAEAFFLEGLELAIQLGNNERRAGITANLGLTAKARGNTELAIARLEEGLQYAILANGRHLTARIHLWLAPLMPPDAARAHLREARKIAQESGYGQLLEQAEQLEADCV